MFLHIDCITMSCEKLLQNLRSCCRIRNRAQKINSFIILTTDKTGELWPDTLQYNSGRTETPPFALTQCNGESEGGSVPEGLALEE